MRGVWGDICGLLGFGCEFEDEELGTVREKWMGKWMKQWVEFVWNREEER